MKMSIRHLSKKPEILVFGAIVVLVVILSLVVNIPQNAQKTVDKSFLTKAPEIAGINLWINSAPLKIGELKGNVVLVDFWTYTCINCIRTIPYLNSWYEKYKDKGLVIIGVHTPEFEFEKDYNNVKAAVEKYGIKYPVVQDNDYATWKAYDNLYWPHEYLIDKDGFIVHDHIGEGAYEETEAKIQELLGNVQEKKSTPQGAISIDYTKVASPETYFGAMRNDYLGNGAPHALGIQTLAEPKEILPNKLYLVGDWKFDREFAENINPAKIEYRYNAKAVYLVSSSNQGATMRVFLDGKPVGKEAGADVISGRVTIKEDRLYRIIEGDNYGEHVLELLIENPGLMPFAFTFG